MGYKDWPDERKRYHDMWTKQWQEQHPDKWAAIQRRHYVKRRRAQGQEPGIKHPAITKRIAVWACGEACWRCGFKDLRALQFDHVRGGGRQERRIKKYQSYKRVLERVWLGEMQLLCANCNWIKRYENGEVKCNDDQGT